MNNKWGRYIVVPLMLLLPFPLLYYTFSKPELPKGFMAIAPYCTNKLYLICSYLIILVIWFAGLFIGEYLKKRGFFEDKSDERGA